MDVLHLLLESGAKDTVLNKLEFLARNCRAFGYPAETILGSLDNENSTLLYTAVNRGNKEVVEMLLKNGASPLCARSILPPLHLACSQGRTDIVQEMVECAGKEILYQPDGKGRTPLHCCAHSIYSCRVISYIAEQGLQESFLNAQDQDGKTPLHLAAELGNLTVVRDLLPLGINPLTPDNDGNNVLHIALKRKNKAIVGQLLQLECIDTLCLSKNLDGSNAIHFALTTGDSDFVSAMLSSKSVGCQQDNKDKSGNGYLHLAALSGKSKAVAAVLDSPIGKRELNATNNIRNTPLHIAAMKGHHSCVRLLLNSGAMVHKCSHGNTPLMVACKHGNAKCAQVLYQAHPFQINWKDADGNTALHFAAVCKDPSTIVQVLNVDSILCQNAHGKSFFDLIIASGNPENALAVVNHRRWQECLDFVSLHCTHPMIGLVESMPEVAKVVLDRSHQRTPQGSLSASYQDYQETFDFKYLNCISHSHPNSTKVTSESEMPEISKNDVISRIKPSMEVLQTMTKYKRVNLLVHPVVSACLEMKWRNYGTWIFMASFVCLLLLVVLLSTFVLIVPNPTIQKTTVLSMNSTNASEPMLSTMTASNYSTDDLGVAAQSIRVVILILNSLLTVHFAIVTFGLGVHCLNFIRYVQKWIYALALIFNFVFLLSLNPLNMWSIGAMACFLSWFTLMLSLEFFGAIGLYVEMFTAVLRTVFQVLIICFFLLMAFAFSFYTLAGNFPEFSAIGYSLFSMIGYMLADIPYSAFVTYDITNSPYGDIVLILVVLVSIVMTIVMANLLIGLAVGDIERVKINAIQEQRTAEIDLFTSIDKVLPKRLLSYLNQPVFTKKCSTSEKSSVKRVWNDIWNAVSADLSVTFQNTQSSLNVKDNDHESRVNEDLADIKRALLNLTEIVHQLQDSRTSSGRVAKEQYSTHSLDK